MLSRFHLIPERYGQNVLSAQRIKDVIIIIIIIIIIHSLRHKTAHKTYKTYKNR